MHISKKPLLSIVMSNYNGADFLHPAINSILSQTYKHFELIIVDDGSTDKSTEIINYHAANDRRIKAVFHAHSGLVPALNYGCNMAVGDFIARHDSDDLAKPNRLQLQVEYLLKNSSVALLGGGIECIDKKGAVLFTMIWPSAAEGLHDHLLMDCYISHSTVMMRKDCFQAVGGYRGMYADAEDYDLYLRTADRHRVDNLPAVLCQYRLHSSSVSSTRSRQQVISGIAARLATRARRSGRPEPDWDQKVVSVNDLIGAGVNPHRVQSLVQHYSDCTTYTNGWRWKDTPFCKLP